MDLNGKRSEKKNLPPNPYHTSSTVILVSAHDSELQSLSSDMQIDDDLNNEKPKHHCKKYVFFSLNPFHNLKLNFLPSRNETEALNSSSVTNVSLKSLHKLAASTHKPNKFEKSYKEMKEEAKLN